MATFNKVRRLSNFNRETYAIYLAFRNPDTPATAKMMGLLTLVYLFMPVDFVPDILPVLGWADDFAVGYVLTKIAITIVPADIMAQCRLEAERRGKNIARIIFIVVACLLVISLFISYLLIKAIAGLFK